jgi:phage terminase large subunit-like protein
MTNYILQYYQQIQDGTVNAPVWIKLSYKMIIEGLQQKLFFYDAKKARKAIGFIEGFCRHHEGALAPQLIKLELWQKAFISCVFGIMDSNDRRQFREVILIIGRKNGKTLLAAAIAAYMTFLDGEYGARIYFTAPKLEQASFCYDAFYQMIQKEPELRKLISVENLPTMLRCPQKMPSLTAEPMCGPWNCLIRILTVGMYLQPRRMFTARRTHLTTWLPQWRSRLQGAITAM